MKFDTEGTAQAVVSGSNDGTFDVDPAAVSAVLLDTDSEAAAFADLSASLLQDLSAMVEDCRSDVIGEQLVGIAEDVAHRGMATVQRRTGNALNAVAEVLTILYSADASMSDAGRSAAATAAQAKADDDPYAFQRPDRIAHGEVTAW